MATVEAVSVTRSGGFPYPLDQSETITFRPVGGHLAIRCGPLPGHLNIEAGADNGEGGLNLSLPSRDSVDHA